MTEKYPSWSPYNYTLDNPLNYFDPDGKGPEAVLWLVEASGYLLIGTAAVASTIGFENTGEAIRVVGNTIINIIPFPTPINSPYPIMQGEGINQITIAPPDATNINQSNILLNENNESIKVQADKISKEIGKNSVTLPDGSRVDLKGRGHRNEQGQKIETPHTHEAEQHVNPETGETFIKIKKIPRQTTQKDLDELKHILNSE